MSSHPDTTSINQNSPVAKGDSSSQMVDGFQIPKHTRRHEQKITKSKAKAASAKANSDSAKSTDNAKVANDPEPLPKINGKEVDTSKPQWELKLTISELKEFKAQQAAKEHSKLHPPHPRNLPKPKAKKGAKQGQSTSKASNAVSPRPLAKTNANGGTASAPNTNSDARSSGLPVPPCGIKGCPVFAQQHESKIYEFNEPCRPEFIKMIQAKSKKASASEWAKVDRFFDLHRFESTQAKKKAMTESRA